MILALNYSDVIKAFLIYNVFFIFGVVDGSWSKLSGKIYVHVSIELMHTDLLRILIILRRLQALNYSDVVKAFLILRHDSFYCTLLKVQI